MRPVRATTGRKHLPGTPQAEPIGAVQTKGVLKSRSWSCSAASRWGWLRCGVPASDVDSSSGEAGRRSDPILSDFVEGKSTRGKWPFAALGEFGKETKASGLDRPCDLAGLSTCRRHKQTRETQTTVVTSQPELPGVCERKCPPPCCRRCRRGGSALWVSVCPVALTIATQLVTTIEHNAERQHLRFVVRRRT